MDAAAEESERQERVAQWAAAEERKQATVEAIAAAEERRLHAVKCMRQGFEFGCASLRTVLSEAAEIERLVAELDETAGNRSTPLQPMHIQPRLSAYVAAMLRQATGIDHFGHLRIARASGEPDVGADWVASERNAFAGYLEWIRRVTSKAKAA